MMFKKQGRRDSQVNDSQRMITFGYIGIFLLIVMFLISEYL